jgi:hypothetical protein
VIYSCTKHSHRNRLVALLVLEYGPNCFVARWVYIFIYIYFIIDNQERRERNNSLVPAVFCSLSNTENPRSVGEAAASSQTLTLTIAILFALMIVLFVCGIVLFWFLRANKLVSEHKFVLSFLQPIFLVVVVVVFVV